MIGLAAGVMFGASAAAETVSLDVTTLTDPTVTLTADLNKPKGPGPFPAVVMLHGCGGIWQRWGDPWSKRLVD